MFNNVFRHSENDDRVDIPNYPAITLINHCFNKGVQSGAIIGLFTIPLLAYKRKISIKDAWKKSMTIAPVLGGIFVPSLLIGKDVMGDLTDDGVDDRAYRIVHNEGQNKVDKYSIIGACSGAIFGVLIGGGYIAAASTGVALSVIYYSAEKSKLVKFNLRE